MTAPAGAEDGARQRGAELREMRRGAVPYRLGTTSFVFPDEVLPNVRLLAPVVDDVEIVIYEYEGRTSLPDRPVIDELNRLAADWGLTYTVHLPLDLHLAAPDPAEREQSVRRALEVIRATAALDPWGWVVHAEEAGLPADWTGWERRAAESLTRVADGAGAAGVRERICLENLETQPPEAVFRAAERAGVAICLDVGHLWKAGLATGPYLDGPLNRARVLHLHGWDGRADHRSLAVLPAGERASLAGALRAGPYRGVATLEVFSADDLLGSYRILNAERGEPWTT